MVANLNLDVLSAIICCSDPVLKKILIDDLGLRIAAQINARLSVQSIVRSYRYCGFRHRLCRCGHSGWLDILADQIRAKVYDRRRPSLRLAPAARIEQSFRPPPRSRLNLRIASGRVQALPRCGATRSSVRVAERRPASVRFCLLANWHRRPWSVVTACIWVVTQDCVKAGKRTSFFLR